MVPTALPLPQVPAARILISMSSGMITKLLNIRHYYSENAKHFRSSIPGSQSKATQNLYNTPNPTSEIHAVIPFYGLEK
jgi:hypothetical protein